MHNVRFPVDTALLDAIEQIRFRARTVEARSVAHILQAFVLPLLGGMGFDVWNPEQVITDTQTGLVVVKVNQAAADSTEQTDNAPRLSIQSTLTFAASFPVWRQKLLQKSQSKRKNPAQKQAHVEVLTDGLRWSFFLPSQILPDASPDVSPHWQIDLDNGVLLAESAQILQQFSLASFDLDSLQTTLQNQADMQAIEVFLQEQLDRRHHPPSDILVKWVLQESHIDSRQKQRLKNLKSPKNPEEIAALSSLLAQYRPMVQNALSKVWHNAVVRALGAVGESVRTATDFPSPPDSPHAIQAPIDVLPSFLDTYLQTHFTNVGVDAGADTGVHTGVHTGDGFLSIQQKYTAKYRYFYLDKPHHWFLRISLDGTWVSFPIDASIIVEQFPALNDVKMGIFSGHQRFAYTRMGEKYADVVVFLQNHLPLLHASLAACVSKQ